MGWLVARLWERLSSRFVRHGGSDNRNRVESLPRLERASRSGIGAPLFQISAGVLTSPNMNRSREAGVLLKRKKRTAIVLKAHLKPGDSIVTGAIGSTGYYSGLKIYDTFGLVDRRVPRNYER